MMGNENGPHGCIWFFIAMLTLTESGSLCCSRKAENSTSLSLDVPMERPCQAGAVGVGAAVGS